MRRLLPAVVAAAHAMVVIGVALLVVAPARAADRGTTLQGTGIDLRIRVAVDPVDPPAGYDACGAVSSLIVYTGERVRWCYRVTNNTSTTLTRHDLETIQFADVITDFPYSMAPGASPFITQHGDVTTSLTEEAVWTAYNPGPADVHTASASARVTVRPGISVEATLGIDPVGPPPDDYCGTDHVLNVPAGRTIRWCFRVTNHSSIPRSRHTLSTALAGTVIEDFPYTLAPGADAFITVTQTMGSTNLEQSGTWTAFRPGPGYVSTATGTAVALGGVRLFVNGFE